MPALRAQCGRNRPESVRGARRVSPRPKPSVPKATYLAIDPSRVDWAEFGQLLRKHGGPRYESIALEEDHISKMGPPDDFEAIPVKSAEEMVAELVEWDHLNEQEFRKFSYEHALAFYRSANSDFFRGTVIERHPA